MKTKVENNTGSMFLKHHVLIKGIAWLLIFIFTISNVAYGYNNSSLRQLRAIETLTQRKHVESLIKGYDHHNDVAIDPALIRAAEQGCLHRILPSEFEGDTILARMISLFNQAGLNNLSQALIALSNRVDENGRGGLQRFHTKKGEWVVRDSKEKPHIINGHAADPGITIRANLTDIEEVAVLSHELLDWFNANDVHGHLGPRFEIAMREVLMVNNPQPFQLFLHYLNEFNIDIEELAKLDVDERLEQRPRLLTEIAQVEVSGKPGTRHYTAAKPIEDIYDEFITALKRGERDKAIEIWKGLKEITRATYNENPAHFAGIRSELTGYDLREIQAFIEELKNRTHRGIFGRLERGPAILERGPIIRDLRFYAQHGLCVRAIDNAERSVGYLADILGREFDEHNIELLVGDIESHEMPPESLQAVRDWAVLHHLPIIDEANGADAAVRLAFNALQPGGLYLGLVKEGDGIVIKDTKDPSGRTEGLGYRFYQLYREDVLLAILERNGFNVIKIIHEVDSRSEPQLIFLAEKPLLRKTLLEAVALLEGRGLIDAVDKTLDQLEREITRLILYPEPDSDIADSRQKMDIFGKDYMPGTFTLAERKLKPDFISAEEIQDYREWIKDIVRKGLADLQKTGEFDILLDDADFVNAICEKTLVILEMHTESGKRLCEEIPNQTYQDVIQRILVILLGGNPYANYDIYMEFNAIGTKVALGIVEKGQREGWSILRFLKTGILCGIMGLDYKSSASAASPIVETNVIRLNWDGSVGEKVDFAVRAVSDMADERRFGIDFFPEYEREVVSMTEPILLVYFSEDLIETIVDLKRLEKMLEANPNISVLFVPRHGRYGNDFSNEDFASIVDNPLFTSLRKYVDEGRFRLSNNGPRGGNTDNRFISGKLAFDILHARDIGQRVIFEVKGARAYEMFRRLSFPAYFSQTVCRELAESVTGLNANEALPVLIRLSHGAVSFSGFRARGQRRHAFADGRVAGLAQMTALEYSEAIRSRGYQTVLERFDGNELLCNQMLMSVAEQRGITFAEAVSSEGQTKDLGGTMGRWNYTHATLASDGKLTLHNATRIPRKDGVIEAEFLIDGENKPRDIVLQTREMSKSEVAKTEGIIGMTVMPRVIIRDDSAIRHRIYGVATQSIPFVREDIIARGNRDQIKEAFDHENRELSSAKHDDIRANQYQGGLRILISLLSEEDKAEKAIMSSYAIKLPPPLPITQEGLDRNVRNNQTRRSML